MKTRFKFKKLIMNTLIAVFILTASSELIPQEKKSDNLKSFKVVVEKTDNGIKMQSVEGSAWVDLSFSISNDRPQAVDEYGMTELNKISSDKDSNLADFLFTITKTENGIVLKGIEGTAWTDLSFSLLKNGKQAIDQFGMTKLN
jgi:arginine repressor